MIIPEIKLIPTPESEEARNAIGYEWNEQAGHRHKLGGTPSGFESKDYPKCSDCGSTMTFYAQIDSIGDNFDLADCMVIHQFVCFDCFTVEAQLNQI